MLVGLTVDSDIIEEVSLKLVSLSGLVEVYSCEGEVTIFVSGDMGTSIVVAVDVVVGKLLLVLCEMLSNAEKVTKRNQKSFLSNSNNIPLR